MSNGKLGLKDWELGIRAMASLWFLFLLTHFTLAVDATVITQESVQCSESVVRLGDVADIFGLNRILVAKLHSVFLSEAPPPGEVLKINRSYIQQRLKITGIKDEQINFRGAWETAITSKDNPAVNNPLWSIIDKYLKDYFAQTGEEYQVQFLHLPQPDVKITANATFIVSSTNERKLRDNTVIVVSAIKDGKEIKSYPVSLKIRRFQRVLVANRDMNLHQVLTPEMFSLERRETTRLSQTPISNIDSVQGMWATRLIPRGSVVTIDKVEPVPAIRQGDVVTIAFDAGDFKITAQGRARKSGLIGEEIPVLNLSSLKEINAKVQDSQTVVVKYTRK